jgi:hypothetical protein
LTKPKRNDGTGWSLSGGVSIAVQFNKLLYINNAAVLKGLGMLGRAETHGNGVKAQLQKLI